MKIQRTLRTGDRGRRSRDAFSLAELMVVIVIIGLLATLVVPNVLKKLNTANSGKVKADLVSLHSAIEAYALDNNGKYPESLEQLVIEDENGHAYIQSSTVPVDPWKHEYQYEPPRGSQKMNLYTYGEDGTPGGEGKDKDITYQMVVDNEI